MSPQRRIAVLSGVAGLLLVLGLWPEEGPTVRPRAEAEESSGPVTSLDPVGVLRDLDAGALARRYAPIREAELFVGRFGQDRDGSGVAPARPPRAERRPSEEPTQLRLWFTGVTGGAEGRAAVFEQRLERRGLLLRAEARIGEASVAAVHSRSVTLSTRAGTQTLALGESLDLPLHTMRELVDLGPRRDQPPTVSSPGVELDPAARDAILERLRERRRRLLAEQKGG